MSHTFGEVHFALPRFDNAEISTPEYHSCIALYDWSMNLVAHELSTHLSEGHAELSYSPSSISERVERQCYVRHLLCIAARTYPYTGQSIGWLRIVHEKQD